jgi:hypothetical protein
MSRAYFPLADIGAANGLVRTALLSVLTLGEAAGAGHSDWLTSVRALAEYLILGFSFLLAPER